MNKENTESKGSLLDKILYSKREKQKIQNELVREEAVREAKAKLSNNLRAPVNTIMGLVQLIRITEQMNPELEKKLDKIDISSQNLCSLLDNILGTAEIEEGDMKMQVSPFTIDRLIQRMEYMLSVQAEEKGISYESIVKVRNRIFIGDIQKIEQTINNLIENAIKFTDASGRIEIYIEETNEQENRSSLRFGVKDTGRGAELSFVLQLPKGKTEDRDEEYDLSAISAESEPEDEKFQGMRVLLAEDNEVNAGIAVSLLAHQKIAVERAVNGQEAVDMFCKNPENYYDIILMDIQMPVMNGWEAVKAIRQSKREDADTVFIAAMTADTSGDSRQKAIQTGMNGFIAKPFEINEIYKILKELKRKKKKNKENNKEKNKEGK